MMVSEVQSARVAPDTCESFSPLVRQILRSKSGWLRSKRSLAALALCLFASFLLLSAPAHAQYGAVRIYLIQAGPLSVLKFPYLDGDEACAAYANNSNSTAIAGGAQQWLEYTNASYGEPSNFGPGCHFTVIYHGGFGGEPEGHTAPLFEQNRVLAQLECPEGYADAGGGNCTANEIVESRPQQCPVNFGNPISCGERKKTQEVLDGGSGDLTLVRHFRSSPQTDALQRNGVWGQGWSSQLTMRLARSAESTPPSIYAYRSDGTIVPFLEGSDGVWRTDPDLSRFALSETTDGWRLQMGVTEEFYDPRGRLIQIAREGVPWLSYDRDTVKRVIKIKHASGRAISLQYDQLDRIGGATFPDGLHLDYAYDTYGRLLHVRRGGQEEAYVYEAPPGPVGAYLSGIIDELQVRYSTFGYNAAGEATSTEHAGQVSAYSVDYQDDVANVSLPTGGSVEISFEAIMGSRRILQKTESCPTCADAVRTTSYSWSSNGYLDSVLLPDGSVVAIGHSATGLEVSRSEIAEVGGQSIRTTETTWLPDLRLPTERRTLDSNGALVAKSTWTYNARGQALTASQVDPASGSTRTQSTTYCEQADVTSNACPLLGLVTGTNGARTDVSDATSYTYRMADAATCASNPAGCEYRKGDLWKFTNALGRVTEYLSYDGAGRVRSVKDSNGVVTEFEYHARGWLTARKVRGTDASTESDDVITRIAYWPTGLVKRVTQADGSYVEYTYDSAQRLTKINDNGGNTIHYTLDNAGNRMAEDTKDSTGTLKRTLSRVYNLLGQLETQADSASNPIDYTYDANGNADTVTDLLSRVTDNDYDPLNRLKRTLQDVGGIEAETSFQYDALDNLTKVTDPKGLDTQYKYNGLGDLLELKSPDTGTATYTYDSAGNRKTQTDARGVVTTYTYDVLNRLTSVMYSDGTAGITYAYDTNSQASVLCGNGGFITGRLATMTDGSGKTTYCYDRFGNIVRKVQVTDSKTFTLNYAYTKTGQLQAITYPGGAVVDYVRNAVGQVTQIGVKPSGGTRAVLLSGATYLPFGPSKGWTYGNGRQLTRSYDLDYQPTAIHDAASGGLSVGFGFDPAGNLDRLSSGTNATALINFGYDDLNRLTATRDGPTQVAIESYDYDATGNRTSFANSAGTQAYAYPATSHRLTAVGAVARSYDAVGNTTAIGGTARQFVYDGAGRMSQAKQGGTVVMNYRYNGRGERVRKYLGTVNAYTLYDESGRWMGDYDTNGAAIQQAVWLDDMPVGLMVGSSAQLRYVEPDHLGTPRVVIDPTRNVAVWRWDLKSEAFGNSPPHQDPDADGVAFVLDMRFPGQRYDAASGLNYNYFRDYEAGTGRYAQSDPIGLTGGPSTYAYVAHQPLKLVDPMGLCYRMGYVFDPTCAPARSTPRPYVPGPFGPDCGTGLGTSWIPDGILAASFTSACRSHDKCYGRCGESKAQCDLRFLRDLRAACGGAMNVICQAFAYGYYSAVAEGPVPDAAFRDAQAEGCKGCVK